MKKLHQFCLAFAVVTLLYGCATNGTDEKAGTESPAVTNTVDDLPLPGVWGVR